MWESIVNFFQTTDFTKINDIFTPEVMVKAIKNPYIVIGSIIILGLLIFLKRFKEITVIISLTSFMTLFNYCLPQGDLETTGGKSLGIFIVGSIIIGVFFVYMIFIRSD